VRLGVEMGDIWKNVELFVRIKGCGGRVAIYTITGGRGGWATLYNASLRGEYLTYTVI
jgi:hypothetical protein